jgi:hypothetical protein
VLVYGGPETVYSVDRVKDLSLVHPSLSQLLFVAEEVG